MDSQKRENLLNLALDSTEEEREKSLELNIGYQKEDNSWEIIVKYHGNLRQALSSFADPTTGGLFRIEELIAGYAILTVPETYIDALTEVEEIEYIEKPKRLFFEVLQGKQASCITPGGRFSTTLQGQGVLVAIIDSGIAYRNRDFRKPDGSTRIRFLWDQTLNREFDEEQINAALNAPTEAEGYALVPSIDTSGHGTAVAGIAAGNGANSDGIYAGVAPESELLIVKLGMPEAEGFPRTTELMRALNYVVQKAIALQMPVSINLSFGNTYGAHNGTSLLERFIDNVSEIGRNVICVGSGNEGASGGHTNGSAGVRNGTVRDATARNGILRNEMTSSQKTREGETELVELIVGNYEQGLNVQLWKDYVDSYRIEILSPAGESFLVDTDKSGKQTLYLEQTKILLYNGEPAPYLTSQEIYFDFLPMGNRRYINSGVWSFRLEPVRTITGNYTFYLPSEAVRSRQTRFVRPTPDVTLTIPATASKVVTVGAYQAAQEAYADFSGRGYLYQDRLGGRIEGSFIKPDIAAPGIGILAPTREGGYETVSGTSFAAPFVTGAAALLMQWGIVEDNDRYLYGEKVKAYLRKGAKSIRGESQYPNARVGYGALCLEKSIPGN